MDTIDVDVQDTRTKWVCPVRHLRREPGLRPYIDLSWKECHTAQ